MRDMATILAVYQGSNGEATKALYDRLEALGPAGHVATNLFRACKASERAKKYRGGIRGKGSYRSMAYERKQWAMDNLAAALNNHADELGIRWGWKEDPKQHYHSTVLYIDLPTGQVSFHTAARGVGPNYPSDWDGIRDAGPGRICRYIETIFAEADVAT